jgi:putative hydrolase of the HAD superfamily
MATTALTDIRAVIFDVHGTLLAGGGPMRFDPAADLRIQELLNERGHKQKGSPTQLLERAVKQHHAESDEEFPEVDLRQLWASLLGVEKVSAEWLTELEHARQPLRLMPSARETLATLSSRSLGLLSNAQADTLPVLCRELGGNPFAADLCVLSYEHGMAKPSARLFELIVARLAARDIPPEATVMVGNDLLHDIAPARAIGLRTVLLTGTANPPAHQADAVISDLSQLVDLLV